jgi:hypothetical protein
MQTAEEILDILIPFKANVSKEENEDSLKQNIEVLTGWVRLHCIEQARVISEKATLATEKVLWDDPKEGEDAYMDFKVIDKNSILNAYSLDNIK